MVCYFDFINCTLCFNFCPVSNKFFFLVLLSSQSRTFHSLSLIMIFKVRLSLLFYSLLSSRVFLSRSNIHFRYTFYMLHALLSNIYDPVSLRFTHLLPLLLPTIILSAHAITLFYLFFYYLSQ